MTDQEIKESVEHIIQWNYYEQVKEIDVLVKLAQAYLDVKCPEKRDIGEMRYGGCNPDYDRGWNDCIDDYRLFLTKRLEGLEEVLLRPTSSKELNTNFGVINESKARFLANAIRRMFE